MNAPAPSEPNDPYAPLLVGRFAHWGVYASENQQYLGRCVVWCRRPEALDLTQARAAELLEVREVFEQVAAAARDLFGATWFNYAFLGNETPHLHAHFIPRYARAPVFLGHAFPDEHYGRNYRTDHAFVTPPGVRDAVIAAYRSRLPQIDPLLGAAL